MKREEKASISITKIICVSIILILISGIGVMAVNTNLKDVKIILQNGYELTVLTSKATVSEIKASPIRALLMQSLPSAKGPGKSEWDCMWPI